MRRSISIGVLVSVFPLAALAQATAQPSFWDKWATPGGIGFALSLILGAVGAVFVRKEVWRRRIAKAIYRGFQVCNDVDEELGTTTLDKPLIALKAANEWMLANGWRKLTPEEEALAKLEFQRLHGEEKQAVGVLTEALSAPGVIAPFR